VRNGGLRSGSWAGWLCRRSRIGDAPGPTSHSTHSNWMVEWLDAETSGEKRPFYCSRECGGASEGAGVVDGDVGVRQRMGLGGIPDSHNLEDHVTSWTLSDGLERDQRTPPLKSNSRGVAPLSRMFRASPVRWTGR